MSSVTNYVGSATTGTFSAGGSANAWGNISNIESNSAFATQAPGGNNTTTPSLDGYNCGFSIPGGSTINGYQWSFTAKKSSAGAAKIGTVWSYIDGAPGTPGSSPAGTALTTTATVFNIGSGSTDTQGFTSGQLSATNCNNNTTGTGPISGVQYQQTTTGTSTVVSEQARQCTIWYTAGGGGGQSGPNVAALMHVNWG
jgi:hypothetical protein